MLDYSTDDERDWLADEPDHADDRTPAAQVRPASAPRWDDGGRILPGVPYRPNPRVTNDVIREGHGFVIDGPDDPPSRYAPCRYCGGPLFGTWPCEFEGASSGAPLARAGVPRPREGYRRRLVVDGVNVVHEGPGLPTRPGLDPEYDPLEVRLRPGAERPRATAVPRPDPVYCECNGCRSFRESWKSVGQPPAHCHSAECKAAHEAQLDEDERERCRVLCVEAWRSLGLELEPANDKAVAEYVRAEQGMDAKRLPQVRASEARVRLLLD